MISEQAVLLAGQKKCIITFHSSTFRVFITLPLPRHVSLSLYLLSLSDPSASVFSTRIGHQWQTATSPVASSRYNRSIIFSIVFFNFAFSFSISVTEVRVYTLRFDLDYNCDFVITGDSATAQRAR